VNNNLLPILKFVLNSATIPKRQEGKAVELLVRV